MKNITMEQATELLQKHIKIITEIENVPLLQTTRRILAKDMKATFDNPSFDRSPVDGYACRATDVENASPDSPARLKVMREIDAGQYSTEEVKRGQAVRIMTGAAIPPGCDCCIRQEDTDYGEEQVCIYRPEKPWHNYCLKGEDFKKGDLLLKKGSRLSFVEAGILAGMGHTKAPVYRLPRVAVFTTGDELVLPGQPLSPGKIYNNNQTLLTTRLLDFGVELIQTDSIPDTPSAMAEALKNAVKNADLVFTTGAVSSGKKDIMHEALAQIQAERIFWGVQARPGTPTLFSVCQEVPILSLSGSPFGVAVMAELMIRPMLQKMKQDDSLGLPRIKGILGDFSVKPGRMRRFLWAAWKQGTFYIPGDLLSGCFLSSMSQCNCLLDVPAKSPSLKKGDMVEAFLL